MGFPQNSTESFTRDRVGHTPRYPREEKFLPNQWLIGYKLTNLRFGRRRSNSGMIHFWLTWIGEGEHWPERMGGAEDDSGQVGDQRPTYMPETLRWFPPSPQQVTSWALYWHPLSHFFLPLWKKSPGIHHPQFLSFLRNALVLFFFFWLCHEACQDFISPPGIEPSPGSKSTKSWTTREFPRSALKSLFIGCVFHNQHRRIEAQSETQPWSKHSG